MNSGIYLFLLSILSFVACNTKDEYTEPAARVMDAVLLKKEVQKQIPYGSSHNDSVEIANEYIDQWIRKKVVLKKAELNLNDEQKDVSRQLEDYKTSLLIFAYEQELVRQKLDTTVSDNEIESYYQKYPGNFELKSSIIKLKYIKVPLKTPNIEKVKTWLQQNDKQKLEKYCKEYAVNYLIDDDNWLLMDDVLKEIPLENQTPALLYRSNQIVEIKDQSYQYIIAIGGYMVKDSKAPLSFVKDNIKNIILNKRKIILIQQMQDEAYKEAFDKKNAEIFK